MRALRAVYEEPQQVRDVLMSVFGVTEEPFMNATTRAWLEFATRTEHDAPGFPGVLLWGHTVRHERADFVQNYGWALSNAGNFASVVSPNQTLAIAVETGDRFTGLVVGGKVPKTNNRKGVRTMQRLLDNRSLLQGSLFDSDEARPRRAALNEEAPLLWIHLIHQSRGDVLGEVSLPIVANEHGRIVGWKCRIILPRWRGGTNTPTARRNPMEPVADATIRVVKRAG